MEPVELQLRGWEHLAFVSSSISCWLSSWASRPWGSSNVTIVFISMTAVSGAAKSLMALQSCLLKKGKSSTRTSVDISTMSTHQQRCAVTLPERRMCAAREREHLPPQQPPQPVTVAPSWNLESNVGKFNLRGRVSAEAAKMRPQVLGRG